MEPQYKTLTQEQAIAAHREGLEVEATPLGVCNWLPIYMIGKCVLNDRNYCFRILIESNTSTDPVDLLKTALVRCITIIQCSHGLIDTEEWANSSKNMQRILAIDAVARAKKALCGTPH